VYRVSQKIKKGHKPSYINEKEE
jgi:hypothetical protein